MSEIIDITEKFRREDFEAFLASYGVDVKICMQCATCVSACPLSDICPGMPRIDMLLVQLGLIDEVIKRLDPWICDQCMKCSQVCPRRANPAKVLAAIRDFATFKYDKFGIGRLAIKFKRRKIKKVLETVRP